MNDLYYIGLDIHKTMIAWCLKDKTGLFVRRAEVKAERRALAKGMARESI